MIRKHKQLSNVGDELNAMGQHMQLSLEMSKRDRRKNLTIILYSHILSLFQSILQEVDAERFVDAYARLPDIVDSAFAAVAVVTDPAAVNCFFDEKDVQRIYRSNSYQALPRDISGKIKYLSGQHFARQAGMTEYFTAIHYVLWRSEEGIGQEHPDYRSEKYAIQLNPLIPACESVFLATRKVADFFNIRDLDREYYECWQHFSDLVGRERAAMDIK